MIIDLKFNIRILLKDNDEKVNISDNQIVQYTGIYYKNINSIVDFVEIQTIFIGKVLSDRYRYDTGITGIYLEPLYIWDIQNNEWNKIIDYKPPEKKYFFYPHLLLLQNYYYNFHPLYFLETCENKKLEDFNNITKTFKLF